MTLIMYLIEDWRQNIDYGRKVFIIGQRIEGPSAKSTYTLYFYEGKRYVAIGNYTSNSPKIGTKYYVSFVEKQGPGHAVHSHNNHTIPNFMLDYDISESPVWYYPELKKIDTTFKPVKPHLYY